MHGHAPISRYAHAPLPDGRRIRRCRSGHSQVARPCSRPRHAAHPAWRRRPAAC